MKKQIKDVWARRKPQIGAVLMLIFFTCSVLCDQYSTASKVWGGLLIATIIITAVEVLYNWNDYQR